MNATILLDNKMAEIAKKFSPHYNIIDIDGKVNKNLYIPSTTVATLSNFTHMREDSRSPEDDPVARKLLGAG